jgi:hypothetical protein
VTSAAGTLQHAPLRLPSRHELHDADRLTYVLHQCFRYTYEAVPAENAVRAAQAACSYSWRTPPRRSCRWMFSRASWSGSVIGSGSGFSGRTLAIP